jgi:hypothetical protein
MLSEGWSDLGIRERFRCRSGLAGFSSVPANSHRRGCRRAAGAPRKPSRAEAHLPPGRCLGPLASRRSRPRTASCLRCDRFHPASRVERKPRRSGRSARVRRYEGSWRRRCLWRRCRRRRRRWKRWKLFGRRGDNPAPPHGEGRAGLGKGWRQLWRVRTERDSLDPWIIRIERFGAHGRIDARRVFVSPMDAGTAEDAGKRSEFEGTGYQAAWASGGSPGGDCTGRGASNTKPASSSKTAGCSRNQSIARSRPWPMCSPRKV